MLLQQALAPDASVADIVSIVKSKIGIGGAWSTRLFISVDLGSCSAFPVSFVFDHVVDPRILLYSMHVLFSVLAEYSIHSDILCSRSSCYS